MVPLGSLRTGLQSTGSASPTLCSDRRETHDAWCQETAERSLVENTLHSAQASAWEPRCPTAPEILTTLELSLVSCPSKSCYQQLSDLVFCREGWLLPEGARRFGEPCRTWRARRSSLWARGVRSVRFRSVSRPGPGLGPVRGAEKRGPQNCVRVSHSSVGMEREE